MTPNPMRLFHHGGESATARGNRGSGVTVGLIDPPPIDAHDVLMRSRIVSLVPDATVVVSADATPAGLGELTNRGCAVVAMPFVLGPAWFDDWDQVIRTCSRNGVLLFAACGNGDAETRFPASHPLVFACGACRPDGSPVNGGSTRVGKWDVAVSLPATSSSQATAIAAAVAVQWLGHAQFLYSDGANRRSAFAAWLAMTGRPLPGGRGTVPRADTL